MVEKKPKGKPKRLTVTNEKISVAIAMEDMRLLRKAIDDGKLVSIAEAIRTGLKMYLKQLGIYNNK